MQAVPAYPYPVKVAQPDGTTLTVILKGDEFYKYHVTEDGILITKGDKGVFNYARLEKGNRIMDTGIQANDASRRNTAERSFAASLTRNPDLTAQNSLMRAKRAVPVASATPKAKFPKTGAPRSLIILVNFNDLAFVTPNPQAAFTDLLNKQGYSTNGATGSAKDYFLDNSMGAFSPQFDVVGPYNLPKSYKYYGENDADENDKNPVQMVVDACAKADSEGVDFSIYDTDGDGLVDNVFVYYAGHNEAEWGHENTIWPHRWGIYPNAMYEGGNYSGTIASVTFDGKRVEDYACTSELKGDEGTSMCGIGTFTHEFGHVLGLADMYATDGSEHQTLSDWNIMDGGSYLNEGRTPPAYNAFERFQLGYLTPEIIAGQAVGKTLESLISSNRAYLISSGDNHNLNGANPDPTEFFLLENRQKTSWDAFLPGKGMLIYRINYNQEDWDYNEPNNNPAKMGVQLMTADGIANDATLSGDPFPGTSNVTSFDFALRSGVSLHKGVRNISESGGIITFSIRKPLGVPVVPADAGGIVANESGFTAAWTAVEGASSYLVEVYTKTEGGGIQTVLAENFDKFASGQPNASPASTDVFAKLNDYTQVNGWTGSKIYEAGGSVKLGSSGSLGYLVTPVLNLAADEGNFTLKFDAMAWSGDDKSLKIFANDQLVHTVTDLNNDASYAFKSYTVPLTGGSDATSIKFEGNKASKGRFFLDNIEIIQGAGGVKVPVINSPFIATGTSLPVADLDSEKSYYYAVRAVDDLEMSPFSNEVGPITLVITGLETASPDRLQVWASDGRLFFEAEEGEAVEVINLSGQRIRISTTVKGLNSIPVQTSGVIIVKVGNRIGKVIL